MKVLVFSSAPTAPLAAGNSARVKSVCLQLKRLGHEVHFIYFDHQSRMTPDQALEMRAQWDGFYYIPFRGRQSNPEGLAWRADDWFQDDIGVHVNIIASTIKPDVVICNYAFHSKIFDYFGSDVIKVLDTHDAFTNRHKMLDDAGLPRAFYYTTLEQEAIQLRRADICLAIQDREATFFRSITSSAVFTVGHLVEKIDACQRMSSGPLRVGYIGSGNHLNVASIREFIKLASIHLQRGDFCLTVAGGVCSHLDQTAGLELLGPIAELQDFYSNIDIVINPMTRGTGLKIKTVEALQHGVPILCTACGSEGLNAISPAHNLSDSREVIAFLLRLDADRSQVTELAEQSRSLFARYQAEQQDEFARLFTSQDSLIKASGGALKLANARNIAARSVLIATHARFWRPGMGSHTRILQLIEELAKSYRVVIFVTWKLSAKDLEDVSLLSLPIEIHGLEEDQIQLFQDHSEDALLGRVGNDSIRAQFKKISDAVSPSVCIVEYLRLSFLLNCLPTYTVRIADTHDLISRRQESRSASSPAATVSRLEEARALSNFDFIITIQRTELAVVDNWGFRGRAFYVPISFKLNAPLYQGDGVPTIGFIGADTEANHDGIQWFLANVWPFFSRRKVRLKIAGSIGRKITTKIDQVIVAGHVDIEDFYASIDVAINPSQWGGGLKIKTVEAMSWGVPVVTTSEGATGVEEANGSGIAIADRPEIFAYHLNQWLSQPHSRRLAAQRAKDFVEAEFDRSVVYRDLHRVIQSASPAWKYRGNKKMFK